MSENFKSIISSNLEAASYDPPTKELIVKFKNDTSYKYPDFPEILWVEWQTTFGGGDKSPGKYFAVFIKHLPCEKL